MLDNLLLFVGNVDMRKNFCDNIFASVQDSSFGYFFGQNRLGMRALSGGCVSWLLKGHPKSTPASKPVYAEQKLSVDSDKTMAACMCKRPLFYW